MSYTRFIRYFNEFQAIFDGLVIARQHENEVHGLNLRLNICEEPAVAQIIGSYNIFRFLNV